MEKPTHTKAKVSFTQYTIFDISHYPDSLFVTFQVIATLSITGAFAIRHFPFIAALYDN